MLWSELLRNDSSVKSPSAVKRDTCSASAAAGRSASNGSIPMCRCGSSPANEGISTRCVSCPFTLPLCGPGQVLIEVKAAGMNFRDVLKALALYPGEAPDARIFGDEVAGIVKSVGAGVTHVAPGDRVFGIAAFGLATHTLARAGDVRRIPPDLSFDEAATLPVVFMTAWHALKNVARIAGRRADSYPCGRRWRGNGGHPNRASPGRGGHCHRWQSDQARVAGNAGSQARD